MSHCGTGVGKGVPVTLIWSPLRYKHADNVIAGRQQTAAMQGLIDVRKKLAEMVEHSNILMGEDTTTR